MSDATHTPGPWRPEGTCKRSDDGEWATSIAGLKEYVCYAIQAGSRKRATAEANARLIAAAPELLGALNSMLAGTTNCEEEARAAIAKAEGRQP